MDRKALSLLAAAAVMAISSASLPAAAGEFDSTLPRFQVNTDLVLLNVTVGDARTPSSPLTADRFEVFENGVPQHVQFFAGADVPRDVAVVLDTSSSMFGKLPAVQDAAIGFISTLKPGDRVLVIGVGSRVTTLQPLTGSLALASAAVRRAQPDGSTALYTAIYTTIDEMRRHSTPGEVRRPVITVFSDGQDTASGLGVDEVLDVARRSGMAIYTIAFETASPSSDRERRRIDAARFGLKALAAETGARAFFLTRLDQVAGTYQQIADDLRRQYSLGYLPTNAARDGTFRRLLVRLKGLALGARTRTGYYAPKLDGPEVR